MSTSYRDALETDSAVNLVSQVQEDGEGQDSWPPEPLTFRREVRGNLADRIRNKMGVKRSRVFIEEETIYGGYSEYTQENSTSFVVICGKRQSVHFEPSNVEDEWPSMNGNDSVFAKMQLWLRSSEDPLVVWSENISMKDVDLSENLTVQRWVINDDSIIHRLVFGRYALQGSYISISQLSNGKWGLAIHRRYQNGEVNHSYKSLDIDSSLEIDDEVKASLVRSIADNYTLGKVAS